MAELALAEGSSVSEIARRFGVRRKTVYKWMARYLRGGVEDLKDRSRRPVRFPRQTAPAVEQAVLAVRAVHPCWGGRKIRAVLKRRKLIEVPSASTVTAILHRHKLIDPRESAKRRELTRFERPAPNDLWQMDFKGEFKLGNGRWCYPLAILDDHSRYSVCLQSCMDQQGQTVKEALIEVFRRHGLPCWMLMDHGKPWFTAHSSGGWTRCSVWLLELGVGVTHGRVAHPQTQGKEERFNRTFKDELKPGPWLADHRDAQRRFDPWRDCYNYERPHEALDMQPPSSRYRVSERAYPEVLPAVEYASHDQVRSVNPVGQFKFQGRTCKTSEAFEGKRLGLRPTVWDGVFEVFFSRHRIGWLDLRDTCAKGPSVAVEDRRPKDLLPGAGRCSPQDSGAAETAADLPPDAEAARVEPPGRTTPANEA
jgi:transposase InsO family protein